ncbi:hypothetical protein [Demequina sp. NBRC 110054]|uniref:hypothetical protein n=1 Tax=Demequina sp. NBRC 110054 TaxID=1570343 RepID=UPI000A06536F|nr:hypothetical protein [Demequina sp. NBRC 110054]
MNTMRGLFGRDRLPYLLPKVDEGVFLVTAVAADIVLDLRDHENHGTGIFPDPALGPTPLDWQWLPLVSILSTPTPRMEDTALLRSTAQPNVGAVEGVIRVGSPHTYTVLFEETHHYISQLPCVEILRLPDPDSIDWDSLALLDPDEQEGRL